MNNIVRNVELPRDNDRREDQELRRRPARHDESDRWAAVVHQQRRDHVTKERAAAERVHHIRLAVRTMAGQLCDPEKNGGLPADEVLWALLRFSAGSLACMALDEPADLKVRRLGRQMQDNRIEF